MENKSIKDQKLRINAFRVTYISLAMSLLGAVIIFSTTFMIFLDWPWDWRQYTMIAIWFVSSLAYLFFYLNAYYYQIDTKFVLVHRFKKEYAYNYGEILYIDKAYSEKHKTIKFVTTKGDMIYLQFDQKGLVYKAMLDKCKNLMELDEIKRRFPNLKDLK